MTSEHEEQIYALVDRLLTEKNIGLYDVVTIAKETMEVTERFEDLTGKERKRIVLTVVRRFVETIDSQEQREQLLSVIEHVLPTAIDVIVAASKGLTRLNMKKTRSRCVALWRGIRGLFCCRR